jgi:hypothetical protein
VNDVGAPPEIAELTASGLFDSAWYLTRYEDVRNAQLDPLLHYSDFGWREGRTPNQYFDTEWYLTQYPDVRDAGLNPLVHYLRHGEREGRKPIWHFDPVWYRAAYDLPPETVALTHFLAQRTSGRFAPMAELYAVLLIRPYIDDPASGDDPFVHYVSDMMKAGNEAFPDIGIVRPSGLVDPNYYLINGSDVHEAELEPVEHFCRYGWREPRKPNIYFDMRWYLQTNPAVAKLNINPVIHYILEGEAVGRRPVPYFDPHWYRETYKVPPERNALAHFLNHRRSQKFSPTPMFDVAWYVQQHPEEMAGSRDPFAHFLQAGTYRDIDPSPAFNAAAYRRRHMGKPSRKFRYLMHPDKDNPLVRFLRFGYR